jgi:hypothetical protein
MRNDGLSREPCSLCLPARHAFSHPLTWTGYADGTRACIWDQERESAAARRGWKKVLLSLSRKAVSTPTRGIDLLRDCMMSMKPYCGGAFPDNMQMQDIRYFLISPKAPLSLCPSSKLSGKYSRTESFLTFFQGMILAIVALLSFVDNPFY